jgi:hypothetical protein
VGVAHPWLKKRLACRVVAERWDVVIFIDEPLRGAETLRSDTQSPYMKALTLLLLACSLSCYAAAAPTSASPVAVGGTLDSSLVAAFLGAVTLAAGLMRIRRRR